MIKRTFLGELATGLARIVFRVLRCLVTAERLGAASSQLFKERDSVQAFNLQDVGDAYAITAVELGHALRAPEAP